MSALTGTPLREPVIAALRPQHDAKLRVKVEASDLCGRFSGRIVRNVDTKAKTPANIVGRCRRITAKTASGVGRSGSSTAAAPTAIGKVIELPSP